MRRRQISIFPSGKIFHLSVGQISLRSNFTRRRRISLRRSRRGPPSPEGRLTDTEAFSSSLLFFPRGSRYSRRRRYSFLYTVHCSRKKISHGRSKGLGCRLGRCFCFAEVSAGHPHPSPTIYQFLFNQNFWDDGLMLF